MTTVIVRHIKESEIEEGLKVVVDSFQDEPFNSAVYDFSDPVTKQLYHTVAVAKAKLYLDVGHAILVAARGDLLVGVAIITRNRRMPVAKVMRSVIPAAIKAIPLLSRINWKRGLKLTKAMKHSQDFSEPFLTLEALAVNPEHQGYGIGKKLIQEVRQMSEEEATGTYLFTASDKNQQIFEHFGYETVETREGAGLTVYHMFRHNNIPHPGVTTFST